MMSSVKNVSGLVPLGRAVLVEPYEPELKTSRIELPPSVKERLQTVDNRVTVIAVGAAAWEDEKAPRAKPGDKVMVTKFSGVMIQGTADGKTYRLINDRDIFCAIEVEV